MPLTDGLSADGTPSAAVFLAGGSVEPDAMAFVARVDLANDSEINSVKGLKGWVLRNLQVTEAQLDALVAGGDVTLERRLVGRHEALELTRAGRPRMTSGAGRPTTRALALPGGDHVLILAHISLDGMETTARTDWDYMVSSLRVDPPGTLARQSLLYGGLALGGLILLVVVMRWLAAARRGRSSSRAWEPASLASEGWPSAVARQEPTYESMHSPRAKPNKQSVGSRAAPSDAVPQTAAATVPAGAVPAAAPTVGGGLRSTLPPSGHWSQ